MPKYEILTQEEGADGTKRYTVEVPLIDGAAPSQSVLEQLSREIVHVEQQANSDIQSLVWFYLPGEIVGMDGAYATAFFNPSMELKVNDFIRIPDQSEPGKLRIVRAINKAMNGRIKDAKIFGSEGEGYAVNVAYFTRKTMIEPPEAIRIYIKETMKKAYGELYTSGASIHNVILSATMFLPNKSGNMQDFAVAQTSLDSDTAKNIKWNYVSALELNKLWKTIYVDPEIAKHK